MSLARKFFSTYQKHYTDLASDTSSIWNFNNHSSDFIQWENQWWCPKCRLFSQANYYLEDDDLLILNYNIINCLLVNFRYFVAHSVGRPLIYPGSTGLLQSGFGNPKIIILNVISIGFISIVISIFVLLSVDNTWYSCSSKCTSLFNIFTFRQFAGETLLTGRTYLLERVSESKLFF